MVKTSVAKVKILTTPPSVVVIKNPRMNFHHMLFTFEAKNSKGEGITGKAPETVNIKWKSDPTKEIKLMIVSNVAEYAYSSPNGVMTIPVKVQCMEADIFVILEFDIEGIKVVVD
jgi:hypothetical protein